jgi:hypothetical protein
MDTLFTVITIVVVVGIMLVAVGALFGPSPYVRHVERYRDARGKRLGSSPRLD